MDSNTRKLARRLTHHLMFLIVMLPLIAGTTAVQEANAQSESGSSAIEGVLMDGNGAAISGATIKIRNLETGLERTVETGG